MGKIVRLWVHDMFWQAERMREPLQWDILTMGDIALLEGNFDLQDISIGGQYVPRSMNLQEIRLLVFGVLMQV